jgi:L-lactate dehydrogenase
MGSQRLLGVSEHKEIKEKEDESIMKIGIVGSGAVGSTAAYAMVMRGIGREIVLVDKDDKRAGAEAEDIGHAVPFAHPLLIKAGGYSELEGCRLVIITAGVAQEPGESRLDLLKRNAAIFKKVISSILDSAPDAVLVVVTNPVDIMTYLATRYARDHGRTSGKVFGSGTTLDTARFRSLLGQHLGVDPQHVHAYVVGEHGDSEVLAWSLVRIGAMTLDDFCNLHDVCIDDQGRRDMDERVRKAAYAIIEGKGATYYGIGSAVAKIAETVLRDQRSILTVSTVTENVAGVPDVSISLPRLVGGGGVLTTFPVSLNEGEEQALRKSAEVIRKAIKQLDE